VRHLLLACNGEDDGAVGCQIIVQFGFGEHTLATVYNSHDVLLL
jgi:hypothetical protein